MRNRLTKVQRTRSDKNTKDENSKCLCRPEESISSSPIKFRNGTEGQGNTLETIRNLCNGRSPYQLSTSLIQRPPTDYRAAVGGGGGGWSASTRSDELKPNLHSAVGQLAV